MASGEGHHPIPTNGCGGSTPHSGDGGGSPSPSEWAWVSALISTPEESTVAHDSCPQLIYIEGEPATSSRKKKRGERAVQPDKKGPGLNRIGKRVGEIVESKRKTTYNEVADELDAEFSNPDSPSTQQFDEKNIRRRVYDAVNVLGAIDIISKDKNKIVWRGMPKTSKKDIEELKKVVNAQKDRIAQKTAHLKELEEQYVRLQNLVQRNKQLHELGYAPSSALAFPYILLQTHCDASVELQISPDEHCMHFDFNSAPFQMHDEYMVIKAMGLCGNKETDCIQAPVANGGECSSTPDQVE